MKKSLWSLPLLALAFVALFAGNCPQNTGTGGDDDSADASPSDSPTAPQSALSVEFGETTFTHTIGTSPCPQLIGTITITNSTDAEASFNATATGSGNGPGGAAIAIRPSGDMGVGMLVADGCCGGRTTR